MWISITCNICLLFCPKYRKHFSANIHHMWPVSICRVYRLHERLVNVRSEYNLRLKSGVTTTQIPMTQVHSVQVLQQSPARVRPELDEVTLRYVHDLLGWVEENQRRVEEGEWGSDLPNVESQLGSHRGLHQSVEEFRSKIERAKADEVRGKHEGGYFRWSRVGLAPTLPTSHILL